MRFILPILYVVVICAQITFLFIILKDMMTDRIELLEHQQESNKKMIKYLMDDRSHEIELIKKERELDSLKQLSNIR